MNEQPGRAFGSSAQSKRSDVPVDLPTARQMLPLVKSIVRDLVDSRTELERLHPEQDSLESHRRELDWQKRARRYSIGDEIAAAERNFKAAMGELKTLGLMLVDGKSGRVAFPTRINGRAAVFTWQPGEDNVEYWNYEDEEQRRPIPTEWVPGTPMRLKSR